MLGPGGVQCGSKTGHLFPRQGQWTVKQVVLRVGKRGKTRIVPARLGDVWSLDMGATLTDDIHY